MKKNLIILLVLSLLLVLAVSCDSSKYGTLEIDTKAAKGVITEECDGAWLEIEDTQIYLNFKDVKEGKVRVDLPIGVYSGVELVISIKGESHESLGLQHVAKTKYSSLNVFVINPNDTTYCELMDQE